MITLGVMHLLVIAASWVLPWPMAASLTVLILLSAAWCWRRNQMVALQINLKGELFVRHKGEWVEAKVLGSSLVLPYITVLNLKLPDRRWPLNVVLLPDSLDAEDFRRLRMWLKWGDVLID